MSNADTSTHALQEFQSRFGIPAGAGDKDDVQRWMQMCKELLEERERLRAEIALARSEAKKYRELTLALEHERYGRLDPEAVKKEALGQEDFGKFLTDLFADEKR